MHSFSPAVVIIASLARHDDWMMERFSQAADNNKDPILAALRKILTKPGTILEIGSGSGQHAIFLGNGLPHVTWQPSDRADSLPALSNNLAEWAPDNVAEPLELDLNHADWPIDAIDAVFAANVLHIVSTDLGEALITGAGRRLTDGGKLICYGPFKYDGAFTTPSNASFDQWLKARDPASGIRDIEWVRDIAAKCDLELMADHDMPANNQLLVFEKQ